MDESGATAIVTALALTVLIGFCGLATDAVVWQVNHRTMQGAADQAALGAVTAYRNAGDTTAVGVSTIAQNAAYATAIQNGYPAANVTLAAYNNGGTCTNNGCLKVTISQNQTRYFSRIFSSSGFTASASAIATCQGCGNGQGGSMAGQACVMALDSSGKGVITVSGTPTMKLDGCDLYNNSPDTNATILNGGGTIEGCSATDACGSKAFLAQSNMPSGYLDIPVVNNMPAAPDPLAGKQPPSPNGACIHSLLSPPSVNPSGTYCPGNITDQTVQFADNSIINITGGLSTKGNSHLSCNGCMLYVKGGGSINANSTVDITASASNSGISVWFGDNSSVTWNGANGSSFKGTIYAPQADVSYSGNAASASTCTRLIAASIGLSGTSTATFDNSGCPTAAGPVRASSGVSGSTANTGTPVLVQ